MSDREKLPKTRTGLTHKFAITWKNEATEKVETSEYYITANTYPDGRLGEVFIKPAQRNDEMVDQWSRAISVMVQRGTDTQELVNLFAYTQFMPAGMTDDLEVKTCSSIVDFVVRWLDLKFGEKAVASGHV